jgi:hypothetical protein
LTATANPGSTVEVTAVALLVGVSAVWHCSLARRGKTDILLTGCLSACELAVRKRRATSPAGTAR